MKHTIPLRSLDKTKQMGELLEMAAGSASLLMLKLDGLTVKLCYENGRLVEASTRGDGEKPGSKPPHNGRLKLISHYNRQRSGKHMQNLETRGMDRLMIP